MVALETESNYPLVIFTKWLHLGQEQSSLWFKIQDRWYNNLYLDAFTMFHFGDGQEATYDSLTETAEEYTEPTKDIQIKLLCLWKLALLTRVLVPETRNF